MNTFYFFISIIFGVFTYLICRENAHKVGQSVLYGLLIGLFWPIVIVSATIFLIIGRIKRQKAEPVDGAELTYEQVKEVVKNLRENREEEKMETEETDKEWEEIKETREEQ